MAKDALRAHARDELGLSEITTARPVQAALTSAASFAVGAAMLMLILAPSGQLVPWVAGVSLALLALLGAIGAGAGGAPVRHAAFRVTFWGALAMGITAGIGTLVGHAV